MLLRSAALIVFATLSGACAAGNDSGALSHPSLPERATIRDTPVNDASEPSAPDAGPPPPMTLPEFLVGYNEAWFGGNFGTDYTTAWDPAYVYSTLDGIAAAGGRLVRLWLWEVPQGIALADRPPQSQSVSPDLINHLDIVLTEARKRGLWVYLTLLDGNTIAKKGQPAHTWGVNLLNNTAGEQDAFNANALAPVLGVLDAHQDNVFAIDIINEIQAASRSGLFADSVKGPRSFLRREVAFIKSRSPWIKVTASAGWPDDVARTGAQYDIANGFYSDLGLDFYDLHAYSDSGTIPGAAALCRRAALDRVPVYLGEFGQSSSTSDDAVQYKATAQFLTQARASCFRGAFAWRYDAAELKWAYVRADGSFRPAVTLMQAHGARP